MTFFLINNVKFDNTEYGATEENMQEDIENMMSDYGGFYNVETEATVDHFGGFDVTINCDHDDIEPWDTETVRDKLLASFVDSGIIVNTMDMNVIAESDN